MFDLASLSLRNIFRNARRTTITVFSIVVGFAAMACFGGFIEFSFEGLRESTIRTQLGHLQIYADGYWKKRVSDLESVLITDPEEVEARIAALPGVSTVTHRLTFSGLGTAGNATVNVSVVGVDPGGEEEFSDFEIPGRGTAPGAGRPRGRADRRGAAKRSGGQGRRLGDGADQLLRRVINAIDFKVAGVVRSSSKEYDSVFAKVPIELAQRARETDKVERIIVLLEDTGDLPELLPRIEEILADFDRKFEIRRWDELAGFYEAVVALYTGLFRVFAGIVGVVVMFSVANTMTMAVFERTGEIGALRAIGARRSTLVSMFLLEGLGVGLIGSGLGVAAAWLLAAAVEAAGGIPMPPPPGMTQGFQAYFSITGGVLFSAFAVTMAATLVSSVYPAFAASRIRIVEALQPS